MRTEPSAISPGRVSGLVFCGFVAGAALQLQQRGLQPGWVYAVLLVVSALAARPCLRRFATGAPRAAAALLLALWFGFAMTGLRAVIFQAGALAPALEGRDIEVTGRILAMILRCRYPVGC